MKYLTIEVVIPLNEAMQALSYEDKLNYAEAMVQSATGLLNRSTDFWSAEVSFDKQGLK